MNAINASLAKAHCPKPLALPVFFRPEMNAACDLPSPSAAKPAKALASWQKLAIPLQVHSFEPVGQAFFELAHDPAHVRSVLACKTKNGFGTTHPEVARSLPYTHGSLLAACRHALQSQSVAVSPTSGFHHAGLRSCSGFCTFNGLACCAMELLSQGLCSKIGILDCDMHYGNGTQEIIDQKKLQGLIEHATALRDYPYDADAFFAILPSLLQRMSDCGLVIYQAGADCHLDDPHGGFLSSEQMRLRDRIVFSFCASRKIPLAWNLAGGYQETTAPDGSPCIRKVLDLHDATMLECAAAYLQSSA